MLHTKCYTHPTCRRGQTLHALLAGCPDTTLWASIHAEGTPVPSKQDVAGKDAFNTDPISVDVLF